jgi:DNA polymerase-3 subunit epsilon
MSLVPLALAHDLGVAVAHRALADCDLIARLLTRCRELGHDIDAMLTRGLRPKVTLMACVSFDDRELAKVAGFHWHAPRKQWLRRMVEADAAFDFPVRVVAEEE